MNVGLRLAELEAKGKILSQVEPAALVEITGAAMIPGEHLLKRFQSGFWWAPLQAKLLQLLLRRPQRRSPQASHEAATLRRKSMLRSSRK
jgi:hypothetical protein